MVPGPAGASSIAVADRQELFGIQTSRDIRSAYGDPRNIIMSTTKSGIDNENEAWD